MLSVSFCERVYFFWKNDKITGTYWFCGCYLLSNLLRPDFVTASELFIKQSNWNVNGFGVFSKRRFEYSNENELSVCGILLLLPFKTFKCLTNILIFSLLIFPHGIPFWGFQFFHLCLMLTVSRN